MIELLEGVTGILDSIRDQITYLKQNGREPDVVLINSEWALAIALWMEDHCATVLVEGHLPHDSVIMGVRIVVSKKFVGATVIPKDDY